MNSAADKQTKRTSFIVRIDSKFKYPILKHRAQMEEQRGEAVQFKEALEELLSKALEQPV